VGPPGLFTGLAAAGLQQARARELSEPEEKCIIMGGQKKRRLRGGREGGRQLRCPTLVDRWAEACSLLQTCELVCT
jgi:hypothetical protein